MLPALLFCQSPAWLQPYAPTTFDKSVEIVLDDGDAVLPGHGRSERVAYTPEFSGTLHVWTRIEGDVDLFVRVETPDGVLEKEDDNSGGGRTPYAKLAVTPGRALVIHVARALAEETPTASAPLSVSLQLMAAPETDVTRQGADAAKATWREVVKLQRAKDLDAARARLREGLSALAAIEGGESSDRVNEILETLGFVANQLSLKQETGSAWGGALRHGLRVAPRESPELIATQQNRSAAASMLGDMPGARVGLAGVLDAYLHTLPETDPNVQTARLNLASAHRSLAEPAAARALYEQVLDVQLRTLPGDHADVQSVRQLLAGTFAALGDFEHAARMQKEVLEVRLRTLDERHPDVQKARLDLGASLRALGDLRAAHALFELAVAAYAATVPEEHPDHLHALLNLGTTTQELGDVIGSRSIFERVLEISLRIHPEHHPDVQLARRNVAVTLNALGDLEGARVLEERVLEVQSRTRPEQHPDLQAARLNLAGTLHELGDLHRARVLKEKVLEVYSRTWAEDHPELQAARSSLARTLRAFGDLQGARALNERVLAVRSRNLPEDHYQLQRARLELAATLFVAGEVEHARTLTQQVLEVYGRTLGPRHPELQVARDNLAASLYAIGDLSAARELYELVFDVRAKDLEPTHTSRLRNSRNLAVVLLAQVSRSVHPSGAQTPLDRTARDETLARAVTLIDAYAAATTRAAHTASLTTTAREAEARCAELSEPLSFPLSVALGYGGLPSQPELVPALFTCCEAVRVGGLRAREWARVGASSEACAAARARLLAASGELARVARVNAAGDELARALQERETAELAVLAAARDASGGRPTSTDLDHVMLSQRLAADELAIAFRVFEREDVSWSQSGVATASAAPVTTKVRHLGAFVVRSALAKPSNAAGRAPEILQFTDLGPIAAVAAHVESFRGRLGSAGGRGVPVGASTSAGSASDAGAALRAAVLDALVPDLTKMRRLVLVLDDCLHLVPFDALPVAASPDVCLGDVLRIETRASLGELLDARKAPSGAACFVGVGGVDFGPTAADAVVASEPLAVHVPRVLRGGPSSAGFAALPGTSSELEGLRRAFAESHGDDARTALLSGRDATRAALLSAAPSARWLHVATHGWVAGSLSSDRDDSPAPDPSVALARRASGDERVRGMSPMLLCGLALAGANIAEGELERSAGLVTADELSTLDLSNCELAVLSACDTARGELRRAGQGVASLQRALQLAGARTVVTSLWKVPDEATKDLMLEFYRRVWVQKQPKATALWEAKRVLRDAKDADGRPRYTLREWGAWVLTGETD